MNENPFLSIVIPSYNEEIDLPKCLESLNNQSYKNFEIIVADDGSTDKTIENVKKIQEKNGKIKIIEQVHKGPGLARNLGAQNAKGDILILVDCDMEFDKNYLKNLIEPIIKGESIGTEEAKQIALNSDNIWSKCWGKYFFDYSHEFHGQIFRAIRKDKFFELGGFDPKYGYGDDRTFYYKYGLSSTRVKGAICYHKNPGSLREVYEQSRWIGSSTENTILNFPFLKYIIPLVFVPLFPIAIPLLAIKKCYKIKKFGLFFPWMLIFMTSRYFGSIEGLIKRAYIGKNTK